MFLLQQRFVFSRKLYKTKEKAQNLSFKLHRLNTLHVLRDWRQVIYIFPDYFQFATIGISRFSRRRSLIQVYTDIFVFCSDSGDHMETCSVKYRSTFPGS